RQLSTEDPLREAKRAEFGEHNPDRAAVLYRQAKDSAKDVSARFWAGLGLARVLHSQKPAEGASLCRDLLKTPSTLSDDDGLSLWSTAAAPCAEWGAAGDVLKRVTEDLESPEVWPAIQIYRFRTILETLSRSNDPSVQRI